MANRVVLLRFNGIMSMQAAAISCHG